MSRFRNAICHTLGMQLKVWLVCKYPSRLEMQLKHPVYKKLYAIVLSTVAVLAVSLSQNGKSCDGNEEEKARSLARKRRGRQSVNVASTP